MRKLRLVARAFAAIAAVGMSAQAAEAAPSAKADDGTPSASQLLAKTKHCTQVSHGKYKNPGNGKAVPICGAQGAFFWTSGMAIDCDGQSTKQCNKSTDPDIQ